MNQVNPNGSGDDVNVTNNSDKVTSVVSSGSGNTVLEPMVIGVSATSTNVRQQETHHKMIEQVKKYHSTLDISQYKGKGKVDLFVCCICFNIFSQQDLLRAHFLKVNAHTKYYTKTVIFIITLVISRIRFMNMKKSM